MYTITLNEILTTIKNHIEYSYFYEYKDFMENNYDEKYGHFDSNDQIPIEYIVNKSGIYVALWMLMVQNTIKPITKELSKHCRRFAIWNAEQGQKYCYSDYGEQYIKLAESYINGLIDYSILISSYENSNIDYISIMYDKEGNRITSRSNYLTILNTCNSNPIDAAYYTVKSFLRLVKGDKDYDEFVKKQGQKFIEMIKE